MSPTRSRAAEGGVDRDALLAAVDAKIRRRPPADGPDDRVESDDGVVRLVSGADGRSGITWSGLHGLDADVVIAAQIARFAGRDQAWEWKHYSHDHPADLPERLLAAGFTAEPAEALLVAEIATLSLDMPPPAGVELRPVVDRSGVDALESLHDEVFGGDHAGVGRALLACIARNPTTAAAVVAFGGATPIAAARVEFHAGTDFASLWGGGTLPAWRHRGVFRAIVAYRARLAAERGFRYLQVDAMPASRPILQRLGFVELTTTTPFTHPG
jgi:GNAT superfamily N-acetyltransferase